MSARYLPYILILPVTLFLCLFFLYPFVLVAQQAFSTGNGFTLENFRDVTGHWKFPISLKNTLYLAAAVVPFQLALALLMASMVSRMKKGRDLVLYVWTIPLGISDLAAGIIWLAIFEQSGFLNSMMSGLGPDRKADQPVDLSEPLDRLCRDCAGRNLARDCDHAGDPCGGYRFDPKGIL